MTGMADTWHTRQTHGRHLEDVADTWQTPDSTPVSTTVVLAHRIFETTEKKQVC